MWANSYKSCLKSILISREITSDSVFKRHLCPSLAPLLGQCSRHTPCPAFTVWHFATKYAALKFAKPWMSNHFSEPRDPRYIVSAMCPESHSKDWRGKSCWLNHGKAAKSSPKDQVEWWHLRPCLVPFWCWASTTIWDYCWSLGTSSLPRAAAPGTLPRGKVGRKMNDKNNIRAWIHDNAQMKSSFTY